MKSRCRICAPIAIALLCAALPGWPMSFKSIPIPSITDQTDVWVRGKVLSIKTRDLPESERHKFESNGALEVTVTIQLSDSAPRIAEPALVVHWATMPDFAHKLTEGQECIAALIRRDDGTYKSLWQLGLYGWYQPRPGTNVVEIADDLPNIPSDLLWELVTTLRNGLDDPAALDAKTRDVWLRRLTQGSLSEFAAAQIVFDTFPAIELSGEALISALETQYAAFQQRVANAPAPYDERDAFRRVLPRTLELMTRVGDAPSVERLIARCVQDLGGEVCVFDPPMELHEQLVRVICARGGEARAQMLTSLMGKVFTWTSDDGQRMQHRDPFGVDSRSIGAIAEFKGNDIDALLLDLMGRPAEYRIHSNSGLASVWRALAERGNREVKTYLDELIANPDSFTLPVRYEDSRENTLIYAREALEAYARNLPRADGITEALRLYRNGDLGALRTAFDLATKDETHLIPVFAAIPVAVLEDTHQNTGYSFSSMATRALPDPAFLPQLRALVESNKGEYVFTAIAACGDPEFARERAVAVLESRLPSRDWRAVYDGINDRTSAVSFLGKLGDPRVAPIVDRFTRPDDLDACRKKLLAAAKADGKEPHDFAVRNLEKCAVLALARAGGPDAVPRLREIYRDGDIAARIVAAMGLYARGDQTGADLVRSFAEHRELENPEIAQRWRYDLFGIFHFACKYLHNFRTDSILLERIERGLDDSDHDLAGYDSFIAINRGVVLRALVQNLESKEGRLRNDAARILKDITLQDFGYDPDKPNATQLDAIAKWREWVNANAT